MAPVQHQQTIPLSSRSCRHRDTRLLRVRARIHVATPRERGETAAREGGEEEKISEERVATSPPSGRSCTAAARTDERLALPVSVVLRLGEREIAPGVVHKAVPVPPEKEEKFWFSGNGAAGLDGKEAAREVLAVSRRGV